MSSDKSGRIVIKKLEKDENHLWEELVEDSIHGTVFHTLIWLRVVERNLARADGSLYLIIGLKGNEVVAGIPFFVSKKHPFTFLQSPPGAYMPYLGPIFPNYESLRQGRREQNLQNFWIGLEKFIRQEIEPSVTTISFSSKLDDVRPLLWAKYQVTPVYDYIGDITRKETVWNDFHTAARRGVSHAQKVGVEVCEGDLDDFNYILDSEEKRIEEKGRKVRFNRDYMKDVFENFHSRGLEIFVARHRNQRVGGIACLAYKDKISLWIGGVTSKIEGIYVNDLLTWRIIEWANTKGFKYCEIEGANIPSISFFKARYNFELRVRYYAEKYSNYFIRAMAGLYKKYRNLGPYAE